MLTISANGWKCDMCGKEETNIIAPKKHDLKRFVFNRAIYHDCQPHMIKNGSMR